jgi:hypothetical protein
VLTLATLLNRTLTIVENGDIIHNTKCLSRNGTGVVELEDFSYDNDVMGCLFLDALRNLSFKGTLVCIATRLLPCIPFHNEEVRNSPDTKPEA